MSIREAVYAAANRLNNLKCFWDKVTDGSYVFHPKYAPMDSLTFMEFIVDVEKRIGTTLNISDSKPYWTIGSMIEHISSKYVTKEDAFNELKAELCKRKLLVTDLDDTYWCGSFIDDGCIIEEGGCCINVDYQRKLIELQTRGVMLAICTRNDMETVIDAFKGLSVIPLNEFAAVEASFGDKAAAIDRICKNVNILPEAVVFVDDNKYERDRVMRALPDVIVCSPEDDFMQYFPAEAITEEDRNRTEMIQQDKERLKSEKEAESHEEWLKSLDMKLYVEEVTEDNVARCMQLVNKANQFNMNGARVKDKSELLGATAFRLVDNFGDMGIVSVVRKNIDNIDIWVVSCRVLNRGVEDTIAISLHSYLWDKNYTGKNKAFWNWYNNKPLNYYSDHIKVITA